MTSRPDQDERSSDRRGSGAGVRLTERTSVLVVHQQMVFAEALAIRLSLEDDVSVVDTISRGAYALTVAPRLSARVVLLGQWVDDASSVELIRRLRGLDDPPHIVLLGETDRPREVVEALEAGAAAWVCKDSQVQSLLTAVRAVTNGQSWLPPKLLGPVLQLLVQQKQRPPGDALLRLTARERDVLQCMVEGLGQDATARRLYVSPNTVRTHRRRTLAKLGVHSSLEAVAVARRAGMGIVLGEQDTPDKRFAM